MVSNSLLTQSDLFALLIAVFRSSGVADFSVVFSITLSFFALDLQQP